MIYFTIMLKTKSSLIAAAVALLLIILSAWYWSGRPEPAQPESAPENQTSTAETAPAPEEQPAAQKPAAQPPAQPAAPPLSRVPSISILSPASGEKWAVGQNNTIKWSKAAGTTGGIYLVRASDKTTVGWISSEVSGKQTSFTWETIDVFLARRSPSKKNIQPGEYAIKIKFDDRYGTEISSPSFLIIYPSEVQIPIHQVSIRNFVFSPASVSVQKGDKVVFTNDDAVTHRVILSGFSPFVIEPGGKLTFDTSILFPGPYIFYSEEYSTLRLTLTVK